MLYAACLIDNAELSNPRNKLLKAAIKILKSTDPLIRKGNNKHVYTVLYVAPGFLWRDFVVVRPWGD